MARELWLCLAEAVSRYDGKRPSISYGICVRCAGYQMLRASRLCYDCVPGQQFRRGNGYEPYEQVVYYCARDGLIKIGTSAAVFGRMHQLSAELLATEPGSYDLENVRHGQFAADRYGGEWFDPSPELLSHIKTLRLPHQRVSHRG